MSILCGTRKAGLPIAFTVHWNGLYINMKPSSATFFFFLKLLVEHQILFKIIILIQTPSMLILTVESTNYKLAVVATKKHIWP